MGAILDHFGYPTPSLTEWQQHVWYDLGAIHSCVYEMRHRLAMGRPPQPHSASSIASVTTSASLVESHPRAGRKTPRVPPESTPVTPSICQPAETFPQSSPAKDKDKRKKRKRKEDDASSRRPKKHKKRASPVASFRYRDLREPDSEERRGLCQCTTSRVLRLSGRGTLHQP